MTGLKSVPLGKYSLRILFAFSIAPFCPEQPQPPDSLCGRLAVDARRLLDVSPRALLCSAECRLYIDNPLIQQLPLAINIQKMNCVESSGKCTPCLNIMIGQVQLVGSAKAVCAA